MNLLTLIIINHVKEFLRRLSKLLLLVKVIQLTQFSARQSKLFKARLWLASCQGASWRKKNSGLSDYWFPLWAGVFNTAWKTDTCLLLLFYFLRWNYNYICAMHPSTFFIRLCKCEQRTFPENIRLNNKLHGKTRQWTTDSDLLRHACVVIEIHTQNDWCFQCNPHYWQAKRRFCKLYQSIFYSS